MYRDIDPDDTETNKWGDTYAKRKVLVYQEVFRPKDKGFANSLKTMAASTGSGMTTYNMKGGGIMEQSNLCSIYAFSNYDEPMHLEQDDARWFVISAMNVKQKSKEFYTDIYKWLDDEGGNEAVAKWFLARDISNFTPGRLPFDTDAKKALANDSLSDVYRRMESTLHNGLGVFFEEYSVFTLLSLKEYMEGFTKRKLLDSILKQDLIQLGIVTHEKKARNKANGRDDKIAVYINPNYSGKMPQTPKELWDAQRRTATDVGTQAKHISRYG